MRQLVVNAALSQTFRVQGGSTNPIPFKYGSMCISIQVHQGLNAV